MFPLAEYTFAAEHDERRERVAADFAAARRISSRVPHEPRRSLALRRRTAVRRRAAAVLRLRQAAR